MLRNVAFVAPDDLKLHIARVLEEPAIEKRAHSLGHPSHVVVLPKNRHELAREVVDETGVFRIDKVAERSVARRDKELAKGEGIEVERVHLANGIPAALVNRNAQKGPCGSDDVSWRFRGRASRLTYS